MRSHRSGARTRVAAISGIVFFTALIVWLTLQLAQGDTDNNAKFASIISMYVAVVSLPVAMISLIITARQTGHAVLIGDPVETLSAVADMLAISVRTQWETEEQIRRVHDPFPLPIRWVNAGEHLTDHWESIQGSPDRHDAISLAGQGDQIAEMFDRVPSHRLVVLGKAGAGKTVLTSRFVLMQLARRRTAADGPVPVIFSLGSWDPIVSSLKTWLTEQLQANYPALAAKDSTGTTTAAALLATGHIMPVLDGFDEIPERLRSSAIKAINVGLYRDARLLLTSRSDEYAAAVETGDVLTAAAVVELSDLNIDDVAQYLPFTTRKAGADDARTKWHPTVNQMRNPDGDQAAEALAATLCTPLMVALARASYSDTHANPQELFDLQQEEVTSDGPDRRRALEKHLFTGFVPAVYTHNPSEAAPRTAEVMGRPQRMIDLM